MKSFSSNMNVAWVIGSYHAGGIAPVCRYAAEGVARLTGWNVTLISIDDTVDDRLDAATHLRHVALGLPSDTPNAFLHWLEKNPQHLLVTSDVSGLEPAFPFFPAQTQHIIQIHDSRRSAIEVATANQMWIDGVIGVADHITQLLKNRLPKFDADGRLLTIHNGAAFPPQPMRERHNNPLRLLYIGSMDPFKGIIDFAPILQKLHKQAVPFKLSIVGGRHEQLDRRFKKMHLESFVSWIGRVPHEDCYRLASEHDILLQPSRKEAFGMVTIEAMSMGCVPLAYDIISGNREIIENGKSGLLLPLGDFSAWAAAIRHLHEDRDDWFRLSSSAMKRVRTEFDGTLMASKITAFLKKVTTRPGANASGRLSGRPENASMEQKSNRSIYQHVPSNIRAWVRNAVGARPRLCHYLLNRW